MELALNLVWAMTATMMVCALLRSAPRPTGRVTQSVALGVLVLILFPVISVTDDLQSVQNPAEPDCCLRRDHVVINPHSIYPSVASLPQPAFAELAFGFLRTAAPGALPAPLLCHPALNPIQNRPPPVA
jgi:hypothetical protein